MVRLTLFILGAALLLTACAVGPTTRAEPQTVTLKAVDIAYEPKTFEVVAGQPVRLTLVNEGALEHDFSIRTIPVMDVKDSNEGEHGGHSGAQSDLHTSAEPGGSSLLEFTPTAPGAYEFYCTVSGHKEAGAIGTLIVK
jgi:uncharacterized cupredoxin-like copper-binding protein